MGPLASAHPLLLPPQPNASRLWQSDNPYSSSRSDPERLLSYCFERHRSVTLRYATLEKFICILSSSLRKLEKSTLWNSTTMTLYSIHCFTFLLCLTLANSALIIFRYFPYFVPSSFGSRLALPTRFFIAVRFALFIGELMMSSDAIISLRKHKGDHPTGSKRKRCYSRDLATRGRMAKAERIYTVKGSVFALITVIISSSSSGSAGRIEDWEPSATEAVITVGPTLRRPPSSFLRSVHHLKQRLFFEI